MNAPDLFGAFANPLRLRILNLLQERKEICVCDLAGNTLDRTHIGGDVLAFIAVAACCRRDEFAAFIAKRNAETVNLWLRRDLDRGNTGLWCFCPVDASSDTSRPAPACRSRSCASRSG